MNLEPQNCTWGRETPFPLTVSTGTPSSSNLSALKPSAMPAGGKDEDQEAQTLRLPPASRQGWPLLRHGRGKEQKAEAAATEEEEEEDE